MASSSELASKPPVSDRVHELFTELAQVEELYNDTRNRNLGPNNQVNDVEVLVVLGGHQWANHALKGQLQCVLRWQLGTEWPHILSAMAMVPSDKVPSTHESLPRLMPAPKVVVQTELSDEVVEGEQSPAQDAEHLLSAHTNPSDESKEIENVDGTIRELPHATSRRAQAGRTRVWPHQRSSLGYQRRIYRRHSTYALDRPRLRLRNSHGTRRMFRRLTRVFRRLSLSTASSLDVEHGSAHGDMDILRDDQPRSSDSAAEDDITNALVQSSL